MKFVFRIFVSFVSFLFSQTIAAAFQFDSSEYDQFRSYHTFELKNKLQVLIVSDQTQRSGAMLSVDIGSAHEPRKVSGLAHLLEHMLFFSSGKYPQEYFFKHFLGTVQGSMNAHTWDRETRYYFEIAGQDLKNFETALDIFSRFFVDPIFTEEAIKREINAVHNEHEILQSDENWRLQEVLRNLASESSNFNHFSIGDYEHLAKKTFSILKEVQNFFDKYYSAHLMHLVVYSNIAIENIQPIIESLFGQIKNKLNWKPPPHYIMRKVQPFNKGNLGSYVWFKSSSVKKMAIIAFPLQGTLTETDDQVKPLDFIQKLLFKKGHNSLFSILKKKGLAHGVSMSYIDPYLDLKFIHIRIPLTNLGEENILFVFRIIFQYLKLISNFGLSEHIYKRISYENYIEKQYEEKKTISQELKELMAIFKEKGKVDKESIQEFRNLVKFDKDHIEKYLNFITNPENALFLFSSTSFEAVKDPRKVLRFKFGRKENGRSIDLLKPPNQSQDESIKAIKKGRILFSSKKMNYYDTAMNFYFTSEKMSLWELNYLRKGNLAINPHLLFGTNEFSAENLEMQTECAFSVLRSPLIKIASPYKIQYNPKFLFNVMYETYSEKANTNKILEEDCLQKEKIDEIKQDWPISIYEKPNLEVWIKSFRIFQVPKIASIFKLTWFSRETMVNNYIFLKTFCSLFQSAQWEILNQIKDAHFDLDFDVIDDWLQIKIYGFSDKLPLVIKSIFSLFHQKGNHYSLESFNRTKHNLYWEFSMMSLEHSFERLFHYFDFFLNPKQYIDTELVANIKAYSHEKFINSLKEFEKSLRIQALFVGNIVKDGARNLSTLLSGFVSKAKKNKDSKTPKKLEYCVLKKGITSLTLKLISSSQADKNDANLVLYYFEHYSSKDLRVLDLIFRHLEGEAFKFLRTKNQIGYQVGAKSFKNKGILGILIFMRGSRFDASEMGSFTEKFLLYFREFIIKNRHLFQKIGGSEDSNSKNVVFLNPNLKSNAAKYFEGINSGKYAKFKEQARETDISLEEIIGFYNKLFFQKKRKLSFQLFRWSNGDKVTNEKKSTKPINSEEKTIFSFDDFHHYVEKH